MKILSIFNHYLEAGGEAHAVESIHDSLTAMADVARCDFASADWTGPNAPAPWKQAAWMIRNPRSVQQLRECHARLRSDLWLIHNVFPVGSAAVYSEAGRLGVPIIQYLHNYRPYSVNGYLWTNDKLASGGLALNFAKEIRHGAWQNSRAKTAWFATVLWLSHALGHWRGVTAWIAISKFLRDKFVAAGVPAEKIFTLPHFWKPRRDSVPAFGKHYLFLGRLSEEKGVPVLIEAWRILERECGKAVPRLVIAGAGPLRSLVETEAAINPAVTFAGHLTGSAKNEALENARAVIVPSVWWEALGLVVYEACDHSRPVLAARSGGLPENVIDAETGLLHEPGNAEQLASHVMELERDSVRCRAMGDAARKWLEQNASEAQWQRGFRRIADYALARML